MKTSSIGSAVIAGGLAVLMAVPRPVLAHDHDEEWATVGKILTGLVVLGAVGHVLQSDTYTYETDRTVYVDRPVYVQQPAPVAVAPTIVYDGVDYVETPVVVYETRYFEGRRMEGCPRVYTRSRRAPREIIVPYGPGRRLYQPGIRGHHAFIQEWAPDGRAWVVIGHHPSIWR